MRLVLNRCWFDAEKCARGVECLKQYRCDFDEENKVFRKTPKHDWTSHGADAMRYLMLGIKKTDNTQWGDSVMNFKFIGAA